MAKHLSPSKLKESILGFLRSDGKRCPLIFAALVATYCSVYFECFCEIATASRTKNLYGLMAGNVGPEVLGRVLVPGLLVLLVIYFLSDTRIFEWMVRHRVLLCIAVLAILLILDINGSSMGALKGTLKVRQTEDTLFGIPRAIRSDEYRVFTPFCLSQAKTGFQRISPAIRGGGTDVTMVYGLPAFAVATLFRPFLWGWFVWGASRGLSFFWCARAVVLPLVTFEFMRILTNDNKKISLYGAILVGFAPIIEWWFAINGVVELFVFGEGLVISLYKLLRSKRLRESLGWSALLAWLLGCYAMILYPSWQIPLVYAFGSIGVWVLANWVSEVGAKGVLELAKRVVPCLFVALLVAIGGVGFSLWQSKDTIAAVSGTVYPGQRFCLGGGLSPKLYFPSSTLVGSLFASDYSGNVCERASFISLFPVGILWAIALVVRDLARRKSQGARLDGLLVAMLVPYAFLALYCTVGFAPWLARLSLLSSVQPGRAIIATGFLDICLLIRCLALCAPKDGDKEAAWWKRLIGLLCAVAISACMVYMAFLGNPKLEGEQSGLFLFAGFCLLLIPVFGALPKAARDAGLMASSCVILVSGLCVNPVQRSADLLTNNKMVRGVAPVVEAHPDALWVAEHTDISQVLIVAGAPLVNGVAVYPDLDRWAILDPEGRYVEQYNRYAHVNVKLGEKTEFTNGRPDTLDVVATPEDLLKLGVRYYVSGNIISDWNNSNVVFTPIAHAGNYAVYEVVPLK